MVGILVIFSGILGFLAAVSALIFGASPLAALALWSGVGLILTAAGVMAPLRPKAGTQRA